MTAKRRNKETIEYLDTRKLRVREGMIPIRIVDKETNKELGIEEIRKEDLGRIYYLADELGLPAEEVFEIVLKRALEAVNGKDK